MARVLVKGNSAYVLDLGLQQISRLVLSTLGDSAKLADPPLALQRKQQVKDSDQIVADLVPYSPGSRPSATNAAGYSPWTPPAPCTAMT